MITEYYINFPSFMYKYAAANSSSATLPGAHSNLEMAYWLSTNLKITVSEERSTMKLHKIWILCLTKECFQLMDFNVQF